MNHLNAADDCNHLPQCLQCWVYDAIPACIGSGVDEGRILLAADIQQQVQ